MVGRRTYIRLCLILIFVLLYPTIVIAETNDETVLADSIREQLKVLELENLTHYVEVIDPDYRQYLPSLDWRHILTGDAGGFDVGQLLRLMLGTLFKEIALSANLLKQLLVIAILSAFLHQLQSAFGNETLVDMAFAVSFLVIIFIGLQSFRTALNLAYKSLNDMATLMYALLPIMASLLAAVGGITSAALFHPILISVVTGIVSLSKTLLFPMLNVNAIVGLIAHFSREFPLGRLSGLIRQA